MTLGEVVHYDMHESIHIYYTPLLIEGTFTKVQTIFHIFAIVHHNTKNLSCGNGLPIWKVEKLVQISQEEEKFSSYSRETAEERLSKIDFCSSTLLTNM